MSNEIIDKMRDISVEIKDSETQIQTNKRILAKLQSDLACIEGEIYTIICLEKTPDGKPAFSNEKVREIELQERLRRHPKHAELKKQFDELDLSIAANLIPALNYAIREFRIYEILCGEIK